MQASETLRLRWSSKWFFLLTLILIAAVATNGKFIRATNELFYHVGPYQEYMQNRLQLIAHALENKQYYLTVPEFKGKYPRSIYYNDIRRDPRDWRNVCYAAYFGLDRIRRVNTGRRPAQAPARQGQTFF